MFTEIYLHINLQSTHVAVIRSRHNSEKKCIIAVEKFQKSLAIKTVLSLKLIMYYIVLNIIGILLKY